VSPAAGGRYTVRRWTGLLALGSEVGLGLVVGLVFGVLQDRMVVNLITITVVLVLAVLAFDRATLAFRADGSGVTWSSRLHGSSSPPLGSAGCPGPRSTTSRSWRVGRCERD